MLNDEAAQLDTLAVAGEEAKIVEPQSILLSEPLKPIPANMVFNIYANPATTSETKGEKPMATTTAAETTKDTQPASIGSGTLPANTVEGTTSETLSSETPKVETIKKIERPTKSNLFSSEQQEKVNTIVKDSVEKEVAKVRTEYEEKEQAAKDAAEEEAARKRGEVEELLGKEKEKTTTLKTQLAQIKTEYDNKLSSLETKLAETEAELASVHETWEQQLDTEIATWPEHLKALDPKELDTDSYSLAKRLKWVEKARVAATEFAKTKTLADTPSTTTGNLPLTEPSGTSKELDQEALYQEYLKTRKANPY